MLKILLAQRLNRSRAWDDFFSERLQNASGERLVGGFVHWQAGWLVG